MFYIFEVSIKIEENLLVVTKEELQKKLAKELKETDYVIRACCREEIRSIKEHNKQNAVIKNPHISSFFLSGLLLCNFFLLIDASRSDKSAVIFSLKLSIGTLQSPRALIRSKKVRSFPKLGVPVGPSRAPEMSLCSPKLGPLGVVEPSNPLRQIQNKK